MNIKIVKLLAAVCAVLIVVLIAEWITAKVALNRLLDSTGSSSSQQYQIDEVPTIALKEKTEEHYVDIVSRPLFTKGRKPVADSGTEQANVVSDSKSFDWQLNGIYTSQNSLSALFSRVNTPVARDNFRKLKIDEDLDGWKLMEIHADKVILMQGDETKELLLRKPKPKELPKTMDRVPNQTQLQQRNKIHRIPAPQPQTAVDAPENSDNE